MIESTAHPTASLVLDITDKIIKSSPFSSEAHGLTGESARLFSVFTLHSKVEPGESISDHILWRIEAPSRDIIWLKINLRVVSGKVEWNTTSMVRVHNANEKP